MKHRVFRPVEVRNEFGRVKNLTRMTHGELGAALGQSFDWMQRRVSSRKPATIMEQLALRQLVTDLQTTASQAPEHETNGDQGTDRRHG